MLCYVMYVSMYVCLIFMYVCCLCMHVCMHAMLRYAMLYFVMYVLYECSAMFRNVIYVCTRVAL